MIIPPNLYLMHFPFYIKYGGIPILSLISLFLIFFLPGIIWRRIFFKAVEKTEEVFSSWFFISLFLYILIFTFLKLVPGFSLDFYTFIYTFVFLILLGTILLITKKEFNKILYDLRVFNSRVVWIGILLSVLLIMLMFDKVFIEDLIVDGIESFEFSKSLKTHILPYWDLENGYFGFYPSFMFFAYPNILSILFFGEHEAAVRLPFFLFIFLTYVCVVKLINGNKEVNYKSLLFIALFLVFTSILQSYYYHAWILEADLAQPAATDLLFDYLFLISSYYLINGNFNLFLLFSGLGTIALPSGRLFLIFTVLSYIIVFQPNKSKIFKLVISAAVLLISIQFAYGLYVRFFPQGEIKWTVGFLIHEYIREININKILSNIITLIIVTGIIPLVIALLAILSKEKISRYFLLIFLFYIPFILLIPEQKLHYYLPISLIVLIIALRFITGRNEKIKQVVFYLSPIVIFILIIIFYPWTYNTSTSAKEVGERTCMAFKSYEEAVHYTIQDYDNLPFFGAWINPHSWIHYADLIECNQSNYNIYFAPKKLSFDGFRLYKTGIKGYFFLSTGTQRELKLMMIGAQNSFNNNLESSIFITLKRNIKQIISQKF